MTEEVEKYIRMELKKGIDSYTVKKSMLAAGYSEQEINDAFISIRSTKKTVAWIVMASLIIFAVAAIIIASVKLTHYYSTTQDKTISFGEHEANIAEAAINENNAGMCDNSGDLRPYCLGIIEGDVSQCNELPANLSEACIMRIAARTDNFKLCSRLEFLEPNCNLFFAVRRKDSVLCEQTGGYKDYCLSQTRK